MSIIHPAILCLIFAHLSCESLNFCLWQIFMVLFLVFRYWKYCTFYIASHILMVQQNSSNEILVNKKIFSLCYIKSSLSVRTMRWICRSHGNVYLCDWFFCSEARSLVLGSWMWFLCIIAVQKSQYAKTYNVAHTITGLTFRSLVRHLKPMRFKIPMHNFHLSFNSRFRKIKTNIQFLGP